MAYHIHITGQVQGVGFRPFIYQLANQMSLTGWVNNTTDGVHIECSASEPQLNQFIEQIKAEKPQISKIESITISNVANRNFHSFDIVTSQGEGERTVRISPDFALCQDCTDDLSNLNNRRNGYAFTTCTNCGPRYSIMTDLPYDRPFTVMDKFPMCSQCQEEYKDPLNRRFYSQTNSCPDCRISLSLFKDSTLISEDQSECLQMVNEALKNSSIVAVKGIGGYLLMCDACDFKSINLLRKRKQRPHKPFALIYPHVDLVKEHLICSEKEEDLLISSAAPIVLLSVQEPGNEALAMAAIAPGLDRVGVMLPYAPLLKILATEFGRPLVATSGNVSGSPIIYEDQSAIDRLSRFTDLVLTHDREILIPQDDSVTSQVDEHHSVLFRRSRGYAPSYFGSLPKHLPDGWLALGAQMKGAFALCTNDQVYISQYLGNLESYDAQEEYQKALENLCSLTRQKITHVLVDKHPSYFTSQFGQDLSRIEKVPITQIQHHEAHFAAVLQENDLIDQKEPVLGVIWDGTGYGRDGNTWGGEFFLYQNRRIERVNHLEYFPQILGDKMSMEPRISALSLGHHYDLRCLDFKEKFLEKSLSYYQSILSKKEFGYTSSMGRLFDGVASILGITDVLSFEGQAAMYLEATARKSLLNAKSDYELRTMNGPINLTGLMEGICRDLQTGLPVSDIARKFHLFLVEMVNELASLHEVKKIAFSGGVFQNNLLNHLMIHHLNPNVDLFFHKDLSPNDESIAFGQIIAGILHLEDLEG